MKTSKIILSNTLILLITIVLASCSFFGKKEETNLNTAETVFQQGDALYEQKNYDAALNMYKSLLVDFPTSDLHIDAQLRIADTYGKLGKYEDQMNILIRLLKENIIPGRVPEIYCQIGKFYEQAALFNPGQVTSDTADYKIALDYYTKGIKYTDSNDQLSKSKAQYRTALVNAKIGQYQEAIDGYNLVISSYPQSPYSVLSKMKLKSPDNTTELSLSDKAMNSYAEILGEQIPSDDGLPAPDDIQEVDDGSDDLFNQQESDMLDDGTSTDESEINLDTNTPEESSFDNSEEPPAENQEMESDPAFEDDSTTRNDTTTVNE